MSRIKEYIEELITGYGNAVEAVPSTYDEETLALVPEVLREFYRE